MVAGLLLPSQNGEPLIWTKSGGLYPLADGCREDARQALGKWVDFSSEKGVVTGCQKQKDNGGPWPVRLRQDGFEMITPIIIPTEQQEQTIGWDQPSVWSTIAGRTPISQQLLDKFRRGLSFRQNQGYKAILLWNTGLERFVVLEDQHFVDHPDGRLMKEQLVFAPWNQRERQDRGWIEGLTVQRTNHTMFIATQLGNFILTSNAIRHGRLAPDFDLLIRCRVFTNEIGKEAAGEVAEYEVLSLPDDIALYRKNGDKFSTYKAVVEVLEVNVDGVLLEHPVLGKLHESSFKRQVNPGDQVVIEVGSPKGESGWKMRAFIEQISSRRRRPRGGRKNRPRPRSRSPSGPPMEYLHGFVINSSKELIFIAFQDGVVGVWSAANERGKPEPMTADDFVFCEVGPPVPYQDTLRREIFGWKRVEWPRYFFRFDNPGRPVSVIQAPARFVKFVGWGGRAVATYTNRYMPVIYDRDGESLRFLKGVSDEELLDMEFVLGVSRITFPQPAPELGGWVVRFLVDRQQVVRQPEPRPLSRNHRQDDRLPANQPYYEPRDYRPTSRNSFDDEFGNGPVLVRTPPPERDPNYREPEYVPRPDSRVGYREQHNYSPQQAQFDESFRSYQPGPSTQRARPQWEKYSSVKQRQSPALDESLSGQNSGHLDQSFTQAPRRRYPGPDVPVTGVCIKAWGGYRIVWLRDGRLALLDTKKKPAELGSFITGMIERLEKPMYDKKLRYDWQVNGFWPCEEAYDVVPLTNGQWARFVCPKARVLEYRPFEDKRVVVLDDVFFGEFLDRDDVLEKLELAPDDEIEVTIRAEITSETTIDWVVESQEAEQRGNDKPLELAEKKPEIITKSTVAALPIPDVVPGAKHDLRRDSESDYGISSNSSQSGEAMPEMTHRELVMAMLNNSRVKEAIQRRQPEALEKAQALLGSNTDQ